jgi:hypothetical protein
MYTLVKYKYPKGVGYTLTGEDCKILGSSQYPFEADDVAQSERNGTILKKLSKVNCAELFRVVEEQSNKKCNQMKVEIVTQPIFNIETSHNGYRTKKFNKTTYKQKLDEEGNLILKYKSHVE